MTETKKRKKRNWKREYQIAKKNRTASYMHKFTRKAKDNRNKNNKARRKLGLKKGDPREAGHKKPLSKGGSNSRKNLTVQSRYANRSKGTK